MRNIAVNNGVVATNVNRIIADRGLKKSAVAKKAGFSIQDFSDMLNGRRVMKAKDIETLIVVLDTEANVLFAKRGELAESEV